MPFSCARPKDMQGSVIFVVCHQPDGNNKVSPSCKVKMYRFGVFKQREFV